MKGPDGVAYVMQVSMQCGARLGDVASQTLRRCRALRLRTHVLPARYDVDDAASLASLRVDPRRLPISTSPQTRAALEALNDVIPGLGQAA